VFESVQASDGQISSVMKEHHILNLNRELRALSSRYLIEILTLILNCLVAQSLEPSSANVQTIINDLQAMHDVEPDVTRQVLSWYGEVNDHAGIWCCDRNSMVKEIGIGLLRPFNHHSVSEQDLIKSWKNAVGDMFEELVQINLLTVCFCTRHSSSPFL
jgi:sister chromatid cohesion protein DCC1